MGSEGWKQGVEKRNWGFSALELFSLKNRIERSVTYDHRWSGYNVAVNTLVFPHENLEQKKQ